MAGSNAERPLGPGRLASRRRLAGVLVSAAAAEWNTRNAALAKSVNAYEDELANWKSDCEGRPYREDDEKALKAGK